MEILYACYLPAPFISGLLALSTRGGADIANKNQMPGSSHTVPHPRTLRKAREQVKAMVNLRYSPQIKPIASMGICGG